MVTVMSACCMATIAGAMDSSRVCIAMPQDDKNTQLRVNQMVGTMMAQKHKMPTL